MTWRFKTATAATLWNSLLHLWNDMSHVPQSHVLYYIVFKGLLCQMLQIDSPQTLLKRIS